MPSLYYVKHAFHALNHCVFDNILTTPKFTVRRLRGNYGYCHGNDNECRIELSIRFPSSRLFMEVLAHEMIHQFQWEQLAMMDHGVTFNDMRPLFLPYDIAVW